MIPSVSVKRSNISYDLTDLDERISLISDSPRPQYMMSGLDESYDMVFLVGYHAGAGDEAGNMSHTMHGRTFYNMEINGRRVNEAIFNSAYAGHHHVPVALITGDSGLKKQLEEEGLLQTAEFVVIFQYT